jgi:CPA1 family monovalent cation:H+ antiporter
VLEFDTGLRWYHFEDLIFKLFLPVLIFESALNINTRALLRNLATVLVLAIPVMLLSTIIIAAILYYGIHHPGFPWIAALICGALLSATDPVAVMDMFKRFKVSERLGLVIEGESLFNDAIAIVLFSLLMSIALDPSHQPGWSDPVLSFLYVFIGGVVFGLALGILALLVFHRMSNEILCATVSLAFAYLAFIGAEEWLHVSGVMAVLSCGLCLGWVTEKNSSDEGRYMLFIWQFIGFIANAFVFLLVGLTITLQMFSNMWLAMLIGVLAILVARAVGVYSTLPWLGKLPGIDPISGKQQFMVYWGGLRGAVAVALALSLPFELEYWYTIQSITYGVVLFSLFIQAPVSYPLLKYLKGI